MWQVGRGFGGHARLHYSSPPVPGLQQCMYGYASILAGCCGVGLSICFLSADTEGPDRELQAKP